MLRPLRAVIVNYPEDQVEELRAINNPEDSARGTRKVPFSRVLYIEQEDFINPHSLITLTRLPGGARPFRRGSRKPLSV